jgi:collagenase-like PrtC family protease
MIAMGVSHVRISPQSRQTGDVVAAFHAVAQGALRGAEAISTMAPWMPEIACNGYWHGRPGMDRANASPNIPAWHERKSAA